MQHVKQQTNFVVGPVYILLLRNKYEGLLGFKSIVRRAAKTLRIAHSCVLLSTVKIIWKTTQD